MVARLPAAAVIVALALSVLTGCGGSAPKATARGSTAPPHAHVSPQPAVQPTAVRPAVPALGHTYQVASHNDAGHRIASTVQATSFDMRVQSSDEWRPRAGHDYAGLTVRVCITADPRHEGVDVSWAPWTLVYTDGTTLEPATTTQMEIDPVLYPDGMVTPVGECRKGVIPFVVEHGHRPAYAEYSVPDSLAQHRWRLTQ